MDADFVSGFLLAVVALVGVGYLISIAFGERIAAFFAERGISVSGVLRDGRVSATALLREGRVSASSLLRDGRASASTGLKDWRTSVPGLLAAARAGVSKSLQHGRTAVAAFIAEQRAPPAGVSDHLIGRVGRVVSVGEGGSGLRVRVGMERWSAKLAPGASGTLPVGAQVEVKRVDGRVLEVAEVTAAPAAPESPAPSPDEPLAR